MEEMNSELVLVSESSPRLYDSMRTAVMTCAQIDELATIKDQAYALKEYARQRDDKELEAKMSEIRLRAVVRIGQLSRELERSEQSKGGRHLTGEKPTKTQQIEAAGLTVPTANRYEQLAAPVEDETAIPVVGAAMETYFANTEANGEVL